MADDSGSAATMLVAVIAIIVIAALGFFLLRGGLPGQDAGGGADINVELPTGGGDGQ